MVSMATVTALPIANISGISRQSDLQELASLSIKVLGKYMMHLITMVHCINYSLVDRTHHKTCMGMKYDTSQVH